MVTRKPFEERFWARVDKSGDCWEWTACKNKLGYGQVRVPRENMSPAHRVSFEMASGPIPDGMEVDHVCHNRGCVKPQHLRLATRKQNMENLSGPRSDNTTGARGVSWTPAKKAWRVRVMHNQKMTRIGYFDDFEEAVAASIAARNQVFTHNEKDKKAA